MPCDRVSGGHVSGFSVGICCRLRGHVPQTDCLVSTSRGDARAIRAETHAADRTRMSLERVEFLARRRVPQTDCLVYTSRDDARAIRAETHAVDIIHLSPGCVGFLDVLYEV